MLVYESNFLKVRFFEYLSLVEMAWLSTTVKMQEGEYKEEFNNYLHLVNGLKSKVTKALVDTTAMSFPITPELQEWTNRNIFPTLSTITTKVAFLVSSALIVQMGIEQTMEEDEGQRFITKYFDVYGEAMQWLSS